MTDTHQSMSPTLHDATLDAEIQLVGDLVVAATTSDGPLTQEQIDAALGVSDDDPQQPAGPGGSAG
jgi:hypothetical protein